MRLLAMALAGTILAGSAWAQPETRPETLTTEDRYDLAIGQATKLSFPTIFDRIDLTADGIVQAKPLSDRVMTLQGLAEGEVIMTVFAGSKELYSATVVVGAERGHVVRMYDGRHRDYTGFYCTDTACGRADKELNGARDIGSVTTVVGGVARTVTYGNGSTK